MRVIAIAEGEDAVRPSNNTRSSEMFQSTSSPNAGK